MIVRLKVNPMPTFWLLRKHSLRVIAYRRKTLEIARGTQSPGEVWTSFAFFDIGIEIVQQPCREEIDSSEDHEAN